MTVVSSALLLARRIRELARRRRTVVERRDALRMMLPAWAAEPLLLAGLSKPEVEGLVCELPEAERKLGLDEVEAELARLDADLDAAEEQMLACPGVSLEDVEIRIGLLVERLREETVTDPEDVFYDRVEARTLILLERVHDDCRALLGRPEERRVANGGGVLNYPVALRADASGLREAPGPSRSDAE
jgi:hypothetical protein